jgi:hypothetical protein
MSVEKIGPQHRARKALLYVRCQRAPNFPQMWASKIP